MNTIEIHDLTVAYHRRPVLWNVDWSCTGPGLIGVIGPNGAGKSTFLKAMLGLVPISSGYVRFWDSPLHQIRKRVGYLPQRGTVDWNFPIRALDVVLMGTYTRLGWFRRPGKSDRVWAEECLEKVDMREFARRQIGQLSGGQQQRIFLARALAQKSDLYLMDEPMAGVDATTEKVIFTLLKEMRDEGKTIVVVHHDLRTVPMYFDSVVLLNRRLIAAGPVDAAFTPETLRITYDARLEILEAAGEALGSR